jgi:hypothetical protein
MFLAMSCIEKEILMDFCKQSMIKNSSMVPPLSNLLSLYPYNIYFLTVNLQPRDIRNFLNPVKVDSKRLLLNKRTIKELT